MWRPSMSLKNKKSSKSDDGASTSKKARRFSFSEDEDSRPLTVIPRSIQLPPMSKIYNSSFRNNKPAELFRKDLISAMKLADSDQLAPEEYWSMTDTWRQEWERGVQVPVNPDLLPAPKFRTISEVQSENFKLPKKFLRNAQDENFNNDHHIISAASTVADKACRYDLDDLDTQWLHLLNDARENLGLTFVDELTVEMVLEELESQCFDNLQDAIKNQEGLGIEYDEDVICDVCRSPDSEDGNEMVFCDACNICVHQACYGITAIPEGSWLCRTCALGISPSCILCPNKGGAMKSTRSGQKWAHVSCALWIPEVSIGCVEKMEPITRISQIPASRWSLVCNLCKERIGSCIQCSVKTCKTAYHVTCAFKHGLEMKAIIDEGNEEDGVKLRSYCEKHTKNSDRISSDSDNNEKKPPLQIKKKRRLGGSDKVWKELEMVTDDKAGAREKRIEQVQSEFYKHVSPKQVSEVLKIDYETVEFIYQYWKLKRKSNHNRPLLTPKAEESDVLCRQQEDSLYARMKMFVHLRQDLERVRNLCYMVSRREKMSRSLFRMREEVFQKQLDLLSVKGTKLSEKERTAAIQANHGENIYDRLYSLQSDRFPLTQAIVAVLEGKEGGFQEMQSIKRFVKRPDKPVQNASEQLRQPNPYAKQYFPGMRRSHRRISLFEMEDGVKERQDSVASDESFNPSSSVDESFHQTKDDCVKIETEESFVQISNRKVLQSKGQAIGNAQNGLSDCGDPRGSLNIDVKLLSEVKVNLINEDMVMDKMEGKENEAKTYSGTLVVKCESEEEPLLEEVSKEVTLNHDDLNDFGSVTEEDLDAGEAEPIIVGRRRLRSSRDTLKSSRGEGGKNNLKQSLREKSISKKRLQNGGDKPVLQDDSENSRKKACEDICQSLFPSTLPRPSLVGYRIPKKAKNETVPPESSQKSRGSSPLSPLSGISTKRSECGTYNQKPNRHPPLPPPPIPHESLLQQTKNWPVTCPPLPVPASPENLNQTSPRLVIKLRKDPDSPHDSFNHNQMSFHVIQNDWDAPNKNTGKRSEKPYMENGNSRYPSRFRTIAQKNNAKAEFAS